MSGKINDGGPAFPQTVPAGVIGAGCGPHVEWGMTLRDYFAAAALANGNIEEHTGAGWADRVADQAYRIADAMIAARGGKSSPQAREMMRQQGVSLEAVSKLLRT